MDTITLPRLVVDSSGETGALWAALASSCTPQLGSELAFTGVDLASVRVSGGNAGYADQEIVNRPEPYISYTGNAARTISFSAWFQVDYDGKTEGSDRTTIINNAVMRPSRFMDAIRYPLLRKDGSLVPPPKCAFYCGSLIKSAVVVVESVDQSFEGPFEPDTLLSHSVKMDVVLRVVRSLTGNMSTVFPTQGEWR